MIFKMRAVSTSACFFYIIVCSVMTLIEASSSPLDLQAVPLLYSSQTQDPPVPKPKHNFQQLQIVVVPPGGQTSQEVQPPSPAAPGYVWVQVPISQQPSAPTVPANPPEVVPNVPSPGIQQPVPVTTQPFVPTIEVDALLKKCLTPRGQYASDSCNKYVNCWDGVAVEQFCPEGLVFHPQGYCDYPENVNCGGRPVAAIPPPPSTTAAPAVPGQESWVPTTASPPTVIVSLPTTDPLLRKRCLKPRGQFRSTTCNKYVNCWDDVVIEQECPEGLLFSSKGYCDYPYGVDCQDASPPPSPPRSSSEVASECPLPVGTFRDKLNCSNYFTCIGGQVVDRHSCPEGLSFNDNIGVCDFNYRVDCDKEPAIYYPRSEFLTNIPQDFMKKVDECKPGSVFRLNPQCTTACLCREGMSEVVQCPAGLAYDSATDKCLLPHLAKC